MHPALRKGPFFTKSPPPIFHFFLQKNTSPFYFLPTRLYTTTLFLSVCLSVCMSVCYKSEFCKNGLTHRAGFDGVCPSLILHGIINSGIFENKVCPELRIYYGMSVVATRCQPRSTKTCDKVATVVGWTKLTVLAAVDVRPLTLTTVYHTERPLLCTARWSWGSASRGSVCDSWYLLAQHLSSSQPTL